MSFLQCHGGLQLEQVDNLAEVCSTSIGQVEHHRRTFKLFAALEVIVDVLHGVDWIENQEDLAGVDGTAAAGADNSQSAAGATVLT